METIKKTICALVAAAVLSACSTMDTVPYEPGDSPAPPVESSTNDEVAWKVAKTVAAIALIAGLVAIIRSIPPGFPAMP